MRVLLTTTSYQDTPGRHHELLPFDPSGGCDRRLHLMSLGFEVDDREGFDQSSSELLSPQGQRTHPARIANRTVVQKMESHDGRGADYRFKSL